MSDIEWAGRSLREGPDGSTLDVRAGIDKSTGKIVEQSKPTDVRLGVDVPALNYVGPGASNDERWAEVVAYQKDRHASRLAEQAHKMRESLGGGSTNATPTQLMTQRVKDEAERQVRASTGLVGFGGLGGLFVDGKATFNVAMTAPDGSAKNVPPGLVGFHEGRGYVRSSLA